MSDSLAWQSLASAPELRTDPRWELVERIVHTTPFQKSAHLRGLLTYLAEHSILNQQDALTERQIGMAVFGKPAGYSPAEDSSVRVHIRQLRLRLHEYYACEGRNETLIIEIPKGSYALEFRATVHEPQPELVAAPAPPVVPARRFRLGWRDAVTGVAIVVAIVCAIGWHHATLKPGVPWPLNGVIEPDRETRVVVADTNTMLRLLENKPLTLEQYLQPGFLDAMIPPRMESHVAGLVHYISDAQLTSFSDLLVSTTLVRLAGQKADQVTVSSARGLSQRDLEHGNFIFVGGPTSNPWVSVFKDRLNFEVVEESAGGRMYFVNKKPKPGEQAIYQGLEHTGSAGEDYATISLLPTESGDGKVLILQGLRQEGTEALGVLLADARIREKLQNALGIKDAAHGSTYFEALIRVRAVAGAPISIDIVATRISQG